MRKRKNPDDITNRRNLIKLGQLTAKYGRIVDVYFKTEKEEDLEIDYVAIILHSDSTKITVGIVDWEREIIDHEIKLRGNVEYRTMSDIAYTAVENMRNLRDDD